MSLKTWAAAMALFASALGVHAQVAALPSPADTQALACLQQGGAKLSYPEKDLRARTPGTVRLALRFVAPDQPPEVNLLYRAATDAMVEAVEDLVRHYRLPCLDGAPVASVQEFAFRPLATEPITWTSLRPSRAPGAAAKSIACLVTPKENPESSGGFLQHEISNVFVDMGFSAPDEPPTVKIRYSSASKGQDREVMDYVARYRAPCLTPGAKPTWMRQHFQFGPQGVSKRVFKDATTLTTFLAGVKGLRDEAANPLLKGVSFDFDTMACPFQVAWVLGLPKLENQVGQIGKPDPNRTEFLAWLAGLELDLKERVYEQLVGQTLIINVGCGKLELGA